MRTSDDDADPFAVFDDASISAAADPFACFGVAVDAEHTAKRPRSYPSPVLPLIQRFVAAHAGNAIADLTSAPGSEAASLAAQLSTLASCMAPSSTDLSQCRSSAGLVADAAWATLGRDGKWPHAAWREAYVIAQVVLAGVHSALDGDTHSALQCLDRAFILGGATDVYRDCIELLDEPPESDGQADLRPPPPGAPSEADACGEPGAEHMAARRQCVGPAMPVERQACPTAPEAFRASQRRRVPLVFDDVARGWPAMQRWHNFGWLRERYGRRLVPVELGSLSGDKRAGWKESLMSVAEFVDAFLCPPCSSSSSDVAPRGEGKVGGGASASSADCSLGYLAQHNLFEQLPQLRGDFTVPAACAGRLQHVNAWLGPAGTVTPLHYDSYDNILTQVVGHKLVRLFDASQTAHLYPCEGGGSGVEAQGNVSAVNVEAPDLERFPQFAKAAAYECVIGPGEGLYIPAGCWHHVRSLSPSWSISFWF